MLLLLNLLKKILNLILSQKLVLLENKFNKMVFASQKTWKKGENLASGNAALNTLRLYTRLTELHSLSRLL